MSGGSLTSAIRRSLRSFENLTEAANYINDIKTVARQIDVPAVGSLFENLTYAIDNNRLTANGIKLHSVENLLRRGELIKFADTLNSTVVIRATDQVGFIRSLGNNLPDLKIREFDDNLVVARRTTPELDVNASSGIELYNKLTPSGRSSFERAMTTIKNTAKAGLAVGVFVSFSVLAANLYQTVVDATEAKKGCYLLRTLNNVTTSCKINNRSCLNLQSTTKSCTPQEIPDVLSYNIAIFLMYAVNVTNLASEIGILLSLGGPLANNNIQIVLNNADSVKTINTQYKDKIKEITDPCITTLEVEGGILPPCRACNPTANATSTEYVDTSVLADNITLQCVRDVSILSTLVDVATGMGVQIFDTLGGLFPYFRTIAIVVIIIIVLVIIASFVFKKKTNT